MDIRIIDFRNNMADTLNRVAYGGERAVLTRRGEPAAALVSMDDLKLLEWAEDQRLGELALQDEAEARDKGEKPIPWEEAEREMDEHKGSRRQKAAR